MDCTTLNGNLIESELFGCKKGAYTDAKEDRKEKKERKKLKNNFFIE
ncbi:MAG: sigma-54 factor interaction domain-containing protein [Bacteroidales bacterium]|nr:sigma-54 factor interaction domain-containing protein [Bacteroidales bacterium]